MLFFFIAEMKSQATMLDVTIKRKNENEKKSVENPNNDTTSN